MKLISLFNDSESNRSTPPKAQKRMRRAPKRPANNKSLTSSAPNKLRFSEEELQFIRGFGVMPQFETVDLDTVAENTAERPTPKSTTELIAIEIRQAAPNDVPTKSKHAHLSAKPSAQHRRRKLLRSLLRRQHRRRKCGLRGTRSACAFRYLLA